MFWEILNSNFSTAFFGAIAGSLTVFGIEWLGRKRRNLVEVNTAIAVLGGLINTYLNIKRQHVVPVLKSYAENQEKFTAARARSIGVGGPPESVVISYEAYLKKFYCPELHFEVSLDKISFLAERDSSFIAMVSMAKRSVNEVSHACGVWNEVVEKCVKMKEEERIVYYFGMPSAGGINNSYFPDTIRNLQVSVDDALFFTHRSVHVIQAAASKALPIWLRRRISKIEIVDEEHKALMPPENYKIGWV